jgi:hypothetical protein
MANEVIGIKRKQNPKVRRFILKLMRNGVKAKTAAHTLMTLL